MPILSSCRAWAASGIDDSEGGLVRAGRRGLVDGTAKVVRGKMVTARREAELGPGDFFGELALLDGERRAATVIATTQLTTIRIERNAFRRLLREEPELAIKLLEGMARRTRRILDAPSL